MARHRKPTAEELLRLDDIAKHLGVSSRFPSPAFTDEVAAACLQRVRPIIAELLPCTGEEIASGLGDHFQLVFEEVRAANDVDGLEARYLKGKREIGFARLRDELGQPGVDALLFQRMHANEHDSDRWVAVLNLQETDAKAYWNRFHELSHRIAEPPQGILPFRRHQFEATNPVEALIDAVASELAFYAPVFGRLVDERYANGARLDFEVIEAIRASYAPTASLLATANAVAKHWPKPAAVVTAAYRGRKNAPGEDRALRVSPQSHNEGAAQARLTFIPNMRVPLGTPIHEAFRSGIGQDGDENLGAWSTSAGKRLTPLAVYTSARTVKECIYAVCSASLLRH